MLVDLLVHERLGVARVVAFVVTVQPVADEVDDDVLVELLAEGDSEPADAHTGLRVVAVHVEDRRLHHLRDIGRVHRRRAAATGVVKPSWLLITRWTVPPVR